MHRGLPIPTGHSAVGDSQNGGAPPLLRWLVATPRHQLVQDGFQCFFRAVCLVWGGGGRVGVGALMRKHTEGTPPLGLL